MRTTYCGLVSEALMGQTVTLMGWAHRRRDHGGVIFIDLRDREGLVQVVCDPDRPDMFKTAEGVRNEFCLKVTGKVRARPAGTENANLTSGRIEVLAHALEVLNPSVTPPFQLDDENLSETTRLDLRRPTMQRNLKLRYRVAMEIRKFLDANGFIDIETPMLTKSTPEGARAYLVPSRVHEGMFFALPQSPQLFKQLLMVAGFDRYYQITKCFRDEDLRADRQPEFTQIDIETSFLSEEEIRSMFETMIRTGEEAGTIVRREGLTQVADAGALAALVADAIAGNPRAVEDYRKGKTAAGKAIVGQVMKASGGKANPAMVSKLVEAELDKLTKR